MAHEAKIAAKNSKKVKEEQKAAKAAERAARHAAKKEKERNDDRRLAMFFFCRNPKEGQEYIVFCPQRKRKFECRVKDGMFLSICGSHVFHPSRNLSKEVTC